MGKEKSFALQPSDINPTALVPPNTSFLSNSVKQKLITDFYILARASYTQKHSIKRAEEMNRIKYFRDVKVRTMLIQLLNLGIIISTALILWKGLICITGCQSPVVVVLTGSMEPGFKRGDILFLQMNEEPIHAGEIVVYNIDGRDIPIVHRVIKVHERQNTGEGEVDILTKGDNNPVDDISLYSEGQLWLNRHHIIGRAKG